MKTATQQLKSTAGRIALGRPLFARTMLASLPLTTMNALKTITETEAKGYRAIASDRASESSPMVANRNHNDAFDLARFSGSDRTFAHNIRGGNP